MGAMKYVFMQRQQRPEIQEQLAIEELMGLPCEPDYPETREFMTEPIEGTCFDPEAFMPF